MDTEIIHASDEGAAELAAGMSLEPLGCIGSPEEAAAGGAFRGQRRRLVHHGSRVGGRWGKTAGPAVATLAALARIGA